MKLFDKQLERCHRDCCIINVPFRILNGIVYVSLLLIFIFFRAMKIHLTMII